MQPTEAWRPRFTRFHLHYSPDRQTRRSLRGWRDDKKVGGLTARQQGGGGGGQGGGGENFLIGWW